MKTMKQLAGVALVFALAVGGTARATIIDFENVTGPNQFSLAGNATDYSIIVGGYDVVVHGGVVLTQTTNLPADQTSIYGTADFAPGTGFLSTLTVSFFDAVTHAPKDISNFFLDVLNGNTINVDYTVADDLGNSQLFNLTPNLAGGQKTVGFAAAGDVVTISAGTAVGGCCAFDFFLDNIHFNEALPAPEPGSLALLGVGLAALGFRRRFDQRA